MLRSPPLTPALLRHVKPPERGQIEIADGGCPGLRLRVSQGGTMTWVLGCRSRAGRAQRISLGQYPGIGLSDARAKARAMRQEVREGADPIAEARATRQKARDADAGIGTLASVLDAYAGREGGGLRTWPEMRRRMDHVFAKLLDRPAADLTGPVIQGVVDGHTSRSSASAAVRYLRPVLKWAAKRGTVARDLAKELDAGGAPGRRKRNLSEDELRRLLHALDRVPEDQHARCLRFILWTAARLNEAAGATWGELDLTAGVWTITPERHKSDRGHRIILPRQACEALEGWHGNAAPEALIFHTRTGSPLSNWDRETKRLQVASETADWQRHDLRRTVATLAGRLGHPPHAIESLLGHLIGSSNSEINATLASTYNRSRYEREAGEALQAVADELDRITKADADNVVRMCA